MVNVELENGVDEVSLGLVAPTLDSIREAQEADPDFVVVTSWVKLGELPPEQAQEGLAEFPRACIHSFSQLHVVEDVLVLHDDDGSPNQRIIVPKSLVTTIIRYFHEGPHSAHDSFQRSYAKIAQQYFWLFMKRDISLYVAACDVCIKFRRLAREPRGSLNPIHVGFRNEIVALDCVGGGNSLPTTERGNRYFLTMIDLFTKYCVVIPMVNHSAGSVVDAFHSHWVLVFGSPYRVHTDQGLEFEGEFATFCEVWRIARSRTTAYHPQGNGACERVNQTIKHNLRKLINECDLGSWDRMLPLAAFAYNTVVHNSTGFSPFFLTFGSDPRVPSDLLIGPPSESDMGQQAFSLVKTLSFAFENARDALAANQRRSKDSYDTGIVERIFCPGQKVFLRIKNLFMKKGSKLLSPWSGPYEVVETKGILVKILDKRVPNGRVEWVHHDRLSNPSIFYERRSKTKDLNVDTPERSKETPVVDENVVETASREHEAPIHSESEDLTPDSAAPAHTQTSVNKPPVITRSGRAVRHNLNPDYVYNHADFCCIMSTLPTNLRVPEGMATATAEMWSRVEREQRVQTVEGLLPSEHAFIHRRTGTHYIYNPEVALFIADVPAEETPFAYVDMATPEPWEEANHAVPGPQLNDCQLLLPRTVEEYPGNASVNRRTPYYGHSEQWRLARPWPPNYTILRGQMSRASGGQSPGIHSQVPLFGRSILERLGSVAPDDSASQAHPPSLIQTLEQDEVGRQLLQSYRTQRASRTAETSTVRQPVVWPSVQPSLQTPLPAGTTFLRLAHWPNLSQYPVTPSMVASVLGQHTAGPRAPAINVQTGTPEAVAQVSTQPQMPAPSQPFFRAPLPPTTTGPAVQWFRSVAPTQGLPQQFTIASTQVTTPSIPVLTPSQPQPVTQMDTDLRREVEKLRQEVEALRNRVASTDVGPKSITASRWLSIDRQGYDEIYVVNFQVLNDTYRKILQASLPGVHAEDVVFTWSVVRNVAQQIIYDPQKMVERGAAPFIASELKYGGRRPRPSTGPSLGSFDLSGSPGTDEFASASDYGAPLDVNPAGHADWTADYGGTDGNRSCWVVQSAGSAWAESTAANAVHGVGRNAGTEQVAHSTSSAVHSAFDGDDGNDQRCSNADGHCKSDGIDADFDSRLRWLCLPRRLPRRSKLQHR